MNIGIVYVISIAVAVIALTLAIIYIKNKYTNIKIDDILNIVTMFNLTMDVIDELNLKNETKIKFISRIVNDTLSYIAENYKGNDVINAAYTYANNLAYNIGVEMNDNRVAIIHKLIDIGLKTLK